MIPRYAQVILVEVRCGCVIICLLREWLCLKPFRRMIARTVPKTSTNQGWDWSNQRPSDQSTHRPTKVAHNCPTDLTNNCLVKPRTIENGYTKLRTIACQTWWTTAWWSQKQSRTVTQRTGVVNKQSRK